MGTRKITNKNVTYWSLVVICNLLSSVSDAEGLPQTISTNFGVDSSSHFPFTVWTVRQLPIPCLLPVWVNRE